MKYDDWLTKIPEQIVKDPLWTVEAYRLALFAADLGWSDVGRLVADKRTRDLSDQLYRALGSIGANISEGYSRGGGRDRVRFYEYALGSARESRGWYYNGRFILGDVVTQHRLSLLTSITRLLLTMIPDQRVSTFKEESQAYVVSQDEGAFELKELASVLEEIPLS